MRTVTKYVADDGSEWQTPNDAIARDSLIKLVAEAMRPLGERPTGNSYENGNGYRQHTKEAVAAVKAALVELSRVPLGTLMAKREEECGTNWDDVYPAWFCRFLDSKHEPLERAWSRLWCIDSQGREWGQVYYASHPEEAEHFEV